MKIVGNKTTEVVTLGNIKRGQAFNYKGNICIMAWENKVMDYLDSDMYEEDHTVFLFNLETDELIVADVSDFAKPIEVELHIL